MKPRILLAPLGVAAVVACSLAPAVTASAAPAAPTVSNAAARAATATPDAPQFSTANGERPLGNFQFGAYDDSPIDFRLFAIAKGGHLRITDVETGKTLCEADSQSAELGKYNCIVTAPFKYGTTEIEARVTDADGASIGSASRSAYVQRTWDDSTSQLDHYDPAKQTATISGTSKADADYTIKYLAPSSTEYETVKAAQVDADGNWSADLTDVAPGSRLRFGLNFNDGLADEIVRIPLSEPVAKPVIKSLEKNGNGFNLYVAGPVGAGVKVESQEGGTLAYRTVGDDGQAYLYFTDPKVEREVSVRILVNGHESEPVTFTVNEGVGSAKPEAPKVSDAAMVGSRMTATVAAEPGAVVKVTDTTGKVVAVKVAGTNGSAQVLFTVPNGRTAGSYEVTQTQAGATSAPTTIPSAQ
jgi:hypothetical protein